MKNDGLKQLIAQLREVQKLLRRGAEQEMAKSKALKEMSSGRRVEDTRRR